MPELPEVENVRRGLEQLLPIGSRSLRMQLLRPDLRFPFPENLEERVRGQSLRAIRRRAKYLIFEFENFQLISHLGMTGSWRPYDEAVAHDHVIWEFENGPTLVFNDPRRFGFISLFERDVTPTHFVGLGPEPLERGFGAAYLFNESRGRVQPLKSFLLDQKTVAGLGNIYVCEVLFVARLSPIKKARALKLDDCERIVRAVRAILKIAIKSGGSTIRDYRQVNGNSGGFQDRFKVYDREGEPCLVCGENIKSLRQSGRSTFWCRKCQR